MDLLNQEFQGDNHFNTSISTDEKEGIDANLKIDAYTKEASSDSSPNKSAHKK